jgi:homoserine O-acetyltransferase
VLLVGISSDWLFPASDVRALAWVMTAAGAKVSYAELSSSHGHDGFLAAAAQLEPIIKAHLEEEQPTFAGAGRR